MNSPGLKNCLNTKHHITATYSICFNANLPTRHVLYRVHKQYDNMGDELKCYAFPVRVYNMKS